MPNKIFRMRGRGVVVVSPHDADALGEVQIDAETRQIDAEMRRFACKAREVKVARAAWMNEADQYRATRLRSDFRSRLGDLLEVKRAIRMRLRVG